MVTTASLTAPTAGTGLSPTELDAYAQHAWLSGRIGEAIDLYSDLARLYRRSPHVNFKLGYLYLSLQDYTSAVKHFSAEIERHGDELLDTPKASASRTVSGQQLRAFMFCTYVGRAEAFRALRETGKADMDDLFVTNRGGNSRQSLLSMGCLFFRFGMYQRADECFERCAAVDNEDPEYLIEHAELRLAQRRYGLAATMFEKCRQHISASSPIYHRALVGEGSALIRQEKLQDAVILLLQAMNTLRNTIRTAVSDVAGVPSASADPVVHPPSTIELIHLYHRATNLYGGLCMMKGELKAALDTFVSVSQASAAFTDIVPFQLSTICIIPGTKNQFGEVIESTKISTKNLSEAVRHLNELEWRYGPDPCLYFHRANIHHATGDFDAFLHDLSLVESTDHAFLKKYLKDEALGDFLDGETLSWIPIKLVEAIHDALESNEYRIPKPQQPSSPSRPAKSRNGAPMPPSIKKHRAYSEMAMLTYLRERSKCSKSQDEYASVFQLDLIRRVPESKRRPGSRHSNLAVWEGVILDEVSEGDLKPEEQDRSVQDLVTTVIGAHGRHACAHMIAGMIELEKFNITPANKHFTDAIEIVDKAATARGASQSSSSSLAQRWQHHVNQKAKFYSLIWRSLTYRVKIEMEKAVEDLNLAAAIPLGDKMSGSDDPMLVIQRTLIMLLNGHLKAAYKLLRQLKKTLRVARRQRPRSRYFSNAGDGTETIDMFSNAGLNTFHLLPLQVIKEAPHVCYGSGYDAIIHESDTDETSDSDVKDRDAEVREEAEEEEAAISMVKYALTKKATPQTEMLDKFYESGLLKLSVTGNISQVIPFFQAILSMDEGYLPPTNFASLEIFKCKEQDFMEEKLFNCFVRLGKRSKWLEKKIRWKFEALIDSNLAHAYLPSDMETLWHRARMVQDQRNFTAAINDLTDCLALMAPHFSWERGKKGEKASFNNETKRTQWLQLQLERGLLYMEQFHWEKAIDDLTMVIAQARKKSPVLQAAAFEARSTCLIRLRRYGHAIQDLQQLLVLSSESKKTKKGTPEDMKRREDRLLNCALVGNLYCQLAVDQMKASTAFARRTSAVTNLAAMKKATAAHLNMWFIKRAGEYFDEADEAISGHFLVQYCRGRMYAISAQSRPAIESLTGCLRLHSMFLPALFLRGCIYAQENLFVLALADFYRVRHRSATYPNLHTSIGYCHLQRGSLAKAVESFTEAILQQSEDVAALYMRGCALQEMFILENAIKDFDQVVAQCPDHHRALYQLGVCWLLLKDYKAALRNTSTIVRLQPEWKDAWVLHGYACFCAERFDSAVSAYGSAISMADSSDSVGVDKSRQRESMLFLFRAIAYVQAGKYTSALTDIDLAIKRDNENYVAFIAKAFCLSKLGERSKAAQTLAHCLPHYKKIQLMEPTEVFDSERVKELMRMEATREVGAPTMASGGSEARAAVITARPEKIFQLRQEHRDCEPKQAVRSLTERRASAFEDRRTSSANLFDRRTSTTSNPLTEPSPRLTRKFSTIASASSAESAAEAAKASAKRILRAKFMRVLKKITFQHRVVKALENATSSKYKKSQQMTRALANVMQPPSKVGWPKGTLTTRLLMWAFNADGIHHVHERKVDDALMAFTLAIQANPLNADTNFNRGNVFLQIDVLHSAVSGFQDAIEQEDHCFRAHNNMGVAYFQMDRLDEAQDAFSIGLHHAHQSKERAILLYNLGVTFQALDKPDEALDFYQQAIANDSTRTEFFNNRSAILHHQMRYAVALEDYNRALKLQSKAQQSTEQEDGGQDRMEDAGSGVEARLNRAQLHIAMGNCTLATQDLTMVLKAVAAVQDQLDAEQSQQKTQASASSARAVALQEDAQLATDLLAFCHKWRTAMRIAVKDFLFALHAVPCFTAYEFSPLFGPELSRLQELERESVESDETDATELHQLSILPLPIRDPTFFDYEQAFEHWDLSDEDAIENAVNDREVQDDVREAKHAQWSRSYASDIKDALRASRSGRFEDAARSLLRAHYKTTLDSHDEYLLLAWRIQVTVQYDPDSNQDGVEKAITILRDFFHERRSLDNGDDGDDDDDEDEGPGHTQQHAKRDMFGRAEDRDDEQEEHQAWKAQRRVIRADLFVLLGSLQQLNGQVLEARSTFRRALRLRHDHSYALLNFFQLSVVLGEYEAALDTGLRLLEMFLAHGADRCTQRMGATAAKRKPRGLLQADRSFSWMTPTLPSFFSDEAIASLSTQLLSLLKEYRGMVSSQIQANTSHIFKTQGAIASIVHELRLASTKQAVSTNQVEYEESEKRQGNPLGAFNQTLDEYHDKILEAPASFEDGSDFHAFYGSFQAQFAELCDEIAKTLPSDMVEASADPSASRNTAGDERGEETIEEFLASIDRSQRRMSGRSRGRPGSTQVASSRGSMIISSATIDQLAAPSTAASPRRSSALSDGANLQPQRPSTGPSQGGRPRRISN